MVRTEHPHIRHIAKPAMHADGVAELFEDWLSLVLRQLVGPRELLFRGSGRLFGVAVGPHVYTRQGFYVGSFAAARGSEVYSAAGLYLGERDVRDRDRLATDLAKGHLRRRPCSPLPVLPVPHAILHAVRHPLPVLPGWCEFPPFEAFADDAPAGIEAA